jgi:hypothetical protein
MGALAVKSGSNTLTGSQMTVPSAASLGQGGNQAVFGGDGGRALRIDL